MCGKKIKGMSCIKHFYNLWNLTKCSTVSFLSCPTNNILESFWLLSPFINQFLVLLTDILHTPKFNRSRRRFWYITRDQLPLIISLIKASTNSLPAEREKWRKFNKNVTVELCERTFSFSFSISPRTLEPPTIIMKWQSFVQLSPGEVFPAASWPLGKL